MRNLHAPAFLVALTLSACGSSDGTTRSGEETTSPAARAAGPSDQPANPSTQTAGLTLPPLADGYVRLLAPTVRDIPPGGDVTHCQYAMAPVDHDMDVLDMVGAQSKFGHHAVAFSYTPLAGQEVGAELKCMSGSTEFSAGAAGPDGMTQIVSGGTFLGGVSASTVPGRAIALPPGVVFRLKKGEGIMLNFHYINTGTEPIDADSYFDIELADADPSRLVAAIFLNINMGFSLPPAAQTTSTTDCVAQADVNVILMGNHMHEHGAHATTEVLRGNGGAVEVLRDDPTWTADMVSNAPMSKWSVDAPFVLHAGDTIRTSCSWNNPTTEKIDFPREMCMGAGFALATGADPKAPACLDGTWLGQGI